MLLVVLPRYILCTQPPLLLISCVFSFSYLLRLEYVVPVVACRIQYDCMTLHCLIPLVYEYCITIYQVVSLCRSLAVLLVVLILLPTIYTTWYACTLHVSQFVRTSKI